MTGAEAEKKPQTVDWTDEMCWALIGHLMLSRQTLDRVRNLFVPDYFAHSGSLKDALKWIYEVAEGKRGNVTLKELESKAKTERFSSMADEEHLTRFVDNVRKGVDLAREYDPSVIMEWAKKHYNTFGIRKLHEATVMAIKHKRPDAITEIANTIKDHEQSYSSAFGFQMPSDDEMSQSYAEAEVRWEEGLRNSTSFIGPWFDDTIRLMSGLTVVGGLTGTGKTTASSNILAYLFEHTDKTAWVITVETDAYKYLGRVACCVLSEDYHAYNNGTMSLERRDKVRAKAEAIRKRFKIIDKSVANVSNADEVKGILEAADKAEVGCVAIDYYQIINESDNRILKSEGGGILKDFGLFLKEFCARSKVPVVLFSQLKPTTAANRDFKTRTEGDTHISNHADTTVEVVADKKHKITTFRFHKIRNPIEHEHDIICKWNRGKLEQPSVQELKDLRDMLENEG